MQRTHDRVQSLAPTLALSHKLNLLASDPQTCAEAFANLMCNFPARRTLSRPLTSAVRRRAATLAPAARCTFDPQPSFEPMTDREEPVMTGVLGTYCRDYHPVALNQSNLSAGRLFMIIMPLCPIVAVIRYER